MDDVEQEASGLAVGSAFTELGRLPRAETLRIALASIRHRSQCSGSGGLAGRGCAGRGVRAAIWNLHELTVLVAGRGTGPALATCG